MDLNHKILGAGEPVILLHGLFGMLDNWQAVAKLLAKDFMVISIDLRNHGKSLHTEEWSVAVMADDVREFMQSNWIHSATILGHSMGGKVAMELALTEPDMVEKLIVVDIGPKAYQPGHQQIFDALHAIPIDAIQSRDEAGSMLSEHIPELGVRQFLLKNISRKKEGGYRWKMNLESITTHYETIIEQSRISDTYENEALFIRGGKSDYILLEDEVLIHEVFTNAEIVTIEGAGHWVHADRRDELVAIVRKFIV